MKSRHMALFGLDVHSGEDEVTNLQQSFFFQSFCHGCCGPHFLFTLPKLGFKRFEMLCFQQALKCFRVSCAKLNVLLQSHMDENV